MMYIQNIEKFKKINWGLKHLVGKYYLIKKYSPTTNDYRKFIWNICKDNEKSKDKEK